MATLFLVGYLLWLLVAGGLKRTVERSSATFCNEDRAKKDEILGLDDLILYDILDDDNED